MPSDSVSPFCPRSRQNGRLVCRNELRGQRMPLPMQRLEPRVGDPLDGDVAERARGQRAHHSAGVHDLARRQLHRAAAGRDLDRPHRRVQPDAAVEFGGHPQRDRRRSLGDTQVLPFVVASRAPCSACWRTCAAAPSSEVRSNEPELRPSWPASSARRTLGVAPMLPSQLIIGVLSSATALRMRPRVVRVDGRGQRGEFVPRRGACCGGRRRRTTTGRRRRTRPRAERRSARPARRRSSGSGCRPSSATSSW